MKVAIPVDSQAFDGAVAENFGRSANFLIYDTDTRAISYIDNSAIMSQGGAGIKAAQMVIDQGVEALITPRCGENAVKVLNAAGVKMFQSISGTAQENLEAFTEERLSSLTAIHEGFHHQG